MDPVSFALVMLGVALNVGGQVALKYSVRPGGPPIEGDLFHVVLAHALNPWLILSVGLYGISFINWRFVLQRLELGVAYPLMSLGFIATFLLGWFLFNEPLSPTRIAGIAVIILGVILLFRPV